MSETKLDWSAYDKQVEENQKYFKLPNGTTNMDLSDWEIGEVMKKQGLKFNLIAVNGEAVTKLFETSSIRLIKKLRPIVDKANKEGKTMISVEVIAVGDGFDRQFEAKEI